MELSFPILTRVVVTYGSSIREANTEVREIFSLCSISFSFAKYTQELLVLQFDGEGGICFVSVLSPDF